MTVLVLGALARLFDALQVNWASWWDLLSGPTLISRTMILCCCCCWSSALASECWSFNMPFASWRSLCISRPVVEANRWPLVYHSTSGEGLPPVTWHWSTAHCFFFNGPSLAERISRPVSSVIFGSDGGTVHQFSRKKREKCTPVFTPQRPPQVIRTVQKPATSRPTY